MVTPSVYLVEPEKEAGRRDAQDLLVSFVETSGWRWPAIYRLQWNLRTGEASYSLQRLLPWTADDHPPSIGERRIH